jgi:hypothetical protein
VTPTYIYDVLQRIIKSGLILSKNLSKKQYPFQEVLHTGKYSTDIRFVNYCRIEKAITDAQSHSLMQASLIPYPYKKYTYLWKQHECNIYVTLDWITKKSLIYAIKLVKCSLCPYIHKRLSELKSYCKNKHTKNTIIRHSKMDIDNFSKVSSKNYFSEDVWKLTKVKL